MASGNVNLPTTDQISQKQYNKDPLFSFTTCSPNYISRECACKSYAKKDCSCPLPQIKNKNRLDT